MLHEKECVKKLINCMTKRYFFLPFEKCQSVTTKWKCGKKRKMSKTTDKTDPKAENI